MRPRLFLGFDFGTHKIGVAVGQGLTQSAKPIGILSASSYTNALWDKIDKIVSEWKPDGMVVGIPFAVDETNAAFILSVHAFSEDLKKRYKVPVFEVDEFLSTRAAHTEIDEKKQSKRRKHHHAVDDIAAQMILESWLNQLSSQ